MRHAVIWIIVLLAVVEGGWMAFDGTRALILGDYVTPSSGRFAGELGPWSMLVEAIGLDPRSTLVKSIFAIYGFGWLVIIVCFVARRRRARAAMLVAAIGALWYLPFGTLLSLIQIVLLNLRPVRAAFDASRRATTEFERC